MTLPRTPWCVHLVLIRGVPRFEAASSMKQMRGVLEGAPVTLMEAEARLRHSLLDLPALAATLDDPRVAAGPVRVLGAVRGDDEPLPWRLVLDDEPHAASDDAETVRPLAPWKATTAARPPSISAQLVSLELDALTVVDDERYLERLASAVGLPTELKAELPRLHGMRVPVVL